MVYTRIIISGFLLSLTACFSGSSLQEKEKSAASIKSVTRVGFAEIEAGIKSYMEEKVNPEDGFFHIQEKGMALRLELVRIHREYLSDPGLKRHFVCVDLADANGDVYDVDFSLQGGKDSLTLTEITLHKVNGKPLYFWQQQEDKIWHKVAVDVASLDLLGVIKEQDEFEFRYQVELPKITEEAKMWVPIASSDSFQNVKLISLKAPGKQQMLEDKENGNTILFLELEPEHSGESLEIIYQVKRLEKNPFDAQEPISDKYLSTSLLMPVGGRFSDIANEAIGGKQQDSKLVQARALYDYIIDRMRYIKTGNYGNGDAVYACDTRTGNCSEFHSFFISLARSAGIPARFSIGAAIPSERNEGSIGGYHCWAEFYAEGKWWPVDISEGNKYPALADYYFGHHPANRIELSRGRDLQLKPGPLSGPINFLAYPLLEVGGEPTLTQTSFSFIRKQD